MTGIMKRSVVCSFVFLLSTLGYGQLPSGNVFVGYSYLNADLSSLGADLPSVSGSRVSLNGWNGSIEGKVLPFIGVVGDFSGYYGSPGSPSPTGFCTAPIGGQPGGCILTTRVSVSEHNFLFGPRASFSVGKLRPFVHVLIGVSHISANASGFSTSSTSFADALGGGIDYRLIPRVSLRLEADALQTRFFSSTQNNVRISTGIAIHF